MFEIIVVNCDNEKIILDRVNSQECAIEYVNALRAFNRELNCYYRIKRS